MKKKELEKVKAENDMSKRKGRSNPKNNRKQIESRHYCAPIGKLFS